MSAPVSPNNPFPGMNPFMELACGDYKIGLLARIAEALHHMLPPDLLVRAEEGVELEAPDGRDEDAGTRFRVDVAVSERWKQGLPPIWQPESEKLPVMVAKPRLVDVESLEEVERWLEVREPGGRVITVIEVLSPANKGGKLAVYEKRRRKFREAGVSIVEIDLVRAGGHAVAAPEHACHDDAGRPSPYMVCVQRAWIRARFEVYPCPLQARLPCFRVPLRPTDADIPLDLQPLIDSIHVTGRYSMMNYERALPRPFSPKDEAWIRERLLQARLLPGS